MIVYRYCVYVCRCYMMLRIMVLYKYRKHIEIEIVGKSQESDWQCFLLISLKTSDFRRRNSKI